MVVNLYRHTHRPMNVAVFGSGSGTNLEALLLAQKNNPSFEIKVLATDRSCRFRDIGLAYGIPVVYHSFVKFFRLRGTAPNKDPQGRIEYDQEMAGLLLQCAMKHQFSIDLIVLAGYMRILYGPLLHRFKNQIINIHPGDLTSEDNNKCRKYAGNDAVFQALDQGEKRTRSSVILVDEGLDTGPILVLGPWVNYEGSFL